MQLSTSEWTRKSNVIKKKKKKKLVLCLKCFKNVKKKKKKFSLKKYFLEIFETLKLKL